MSQDLVLVSHGDLAAGLKSAVEMIMGPQKHIRTVGLYECEGQVDFLTRFEDVTQDLDSFIVFADLMGGTPCNVVSRLVLEGKHITLYAGMNMPMVINFINGDAIESHQALCSAAQQMIVCVNDVLAASVVDDEDEL